jgi:DNA modification methylase
MSQSFSSKSFSSEINKTTRNTEEINNTPFNSTDYEKQFGSQDNHSSGPQRLNCNLCPGKTFKDNTRLKIHVDKYHTNNNLTTSSNFSSTVSITKLLINLKQQRPTIRRLPKACRHLAADKLSSIINNCLSTKSIFSFENLLLFSYRAFNVAEKSDKSLNKHIKDNLSNFEVPQIRTASKKRTHLYH